MELVNTSHWRYPGDCPVQAKWYNFKFTSLYILLSLTRKENTDSITFCYLLIRVSHRDLLPFNLKIWIYRYSPSNPLEFNIKKILYCSTQLGILTLMVIKSRSILKKTEVQFNRKKQTFKMRVPNNNFLIFVEYKTWILKYIFYDNNSIVSNFFFHV